MNTLTRKGARTIKDIPPDILQALHAGEIESANLVEWLAINQSLLLENCLKALGKESYLPAIRQQLASLSKPSANRLQAAIGEALRLQLARQPDEALWQALCAHRSDTVRCWVAYCIGQDSSLASEILFEKIKPFAADSHFGVREVAWMACRPHIAAHLEVSIKILTTWAKSEDENLRRFASEATRPRGVWCAHLQALKEQPALALPILEALQADSSRYVQNSVGNWLNDAAKSQADFVRNLCAAWQVQSPTKATAYIIKRALRSIS